MILASHRVSSGDRVLWHGALAWRSVRVGVATAAMGGLLVRLLVPVDDSWIAAAVAVGCAVLAIVLASLGRGELPPPGAERSVALEFLGATGQWAQAFARSALVLAAFAAGLFLGSLLGLDRA